jgi:hypothetical protein
MGRFPADPKVRTPHPTGQSRFGRTQTSITRDHDATIFTSILCDRGFRIPDFFEFVALLAADLKTLGAISTGQLVSIDRQVAVMTPEPVTFLR